MYHFPSRSMIAVNSLWSVFFGMHSIVLRARSADKCRILGNGGPARSVRRTEQRSL
jgi:hypothetical protein